jgi:hypothetical protein
MIDDRGGRGEGSVTAQMTSRLSGDDDGMVVVGGGVGGVGIGSYGYLLLPQYAISASCAILSSCSTILLSLCGTGCDFVVYSSSSHSPSYMSTGPPPPAIGVGDSNDNVAIESGYVLRHEGDGDIVG